jgi:hypothetical protein
MDFLSRGAWFRDPDEPDALNNWKAGRHGYRGNGSKLGKITPHCARGRVHEDGNPMGLEKS